MKFTSLIISLLLHLELYIINNTSMPLESTKNFKLDEKLCSTEDFNLYIYYMHTHIRCIVKT